MTHPVRVLIVEDTAFLREMLTQLFTKRKDIQIVGAARNGKELLPHIESLYPDVVLVDLVLPGENGLQLIEHITQTCPELKVIACSSLNAEHIILQALRAGASDFIAKPFNAEQLTEAVLATG